MTQPVSVASFREALAHFASGVTVVTAYHASGRFGFTATGFSSASLVPPLVLVCIGKDASAYEAVVGARSFGVNILEEHQGWIATQFARKGVDRFAGVALSDREVDHAPWIEGALARLACRRHALHDAGDHTIVVGEVLELAIGIGRPLVHYARHFGQFVPDGSTHGGSGAGAPSTGSGNEGAKREGT